MLLLKPNCECCAKLLDPSAPDAQICSFECTFCNACADKLQFVCPNCAGRLTGRPTRSPEKLRGNPASTVRHVRSTPCLG